MSVTRSLARKPTWKTIVKNVWEKNRRQEFMYQEMYNVICVDSGNQLQIYRAIEEFVPEVFRQSSVGGESQVKSSQDYNNSD